MIACRFYSIITNLPVVIPNLFSLSQEMETIKETDDEDSELHEGKTLIPNKDMSELAVKTLEELTKQPGLTRKSTFPRNFSTMSFMANRKRKPSQESIFSSYSRLDFTGSSLQLHLEVSHDDTVRRNHFSTIKIGQ